MLLISFTHPEIVLELAEMPSDSEVVVETSGVAGSHSTVQGRSLASIHLLSLAALCVLAEMGLLTANYARQSLLYVVNLLNCYSMLMLS
jgi:hypothetical protein